MRPAEYDDEAIINAGKALLAEGKNATGSALRAALGGGDTKRLRKVWDEFLASTVASDASAGAIDLPYEVEQSLATATDRLSAQLRQMATLIHTSSHNVSEQRVNRARAQIEELTSKYEIELDASDKALLQAEEAADAASEQLKVCRLELANSHERIEQLTQEGARMREREAASADRIQEQDRLIADLQTQLLAAKREATDSAAEAAVQADRVSRLENANGLLTEQAASAGHELTQCRTELAITKDQLTQKIAQYAEVQVSLEAVTDNMIRVRDEAAINKERVVGHENTIRGLNQRLEEMRTQAHRSNQEVLRLEKVLGLNQQG